MAVIAINPRFRRIAIKGYPRELTLAEMLSDSIVQAVMEADGIDAEVLETELRSIAEGLSNLPHATPKESRAAIVETL